MYNIIYNNIVCNIIPNINTNTPPITNTPAQNINASPPTHPIKHAG
jgi:hypothetical protein